MGDIVKIDKETAEKELSKLCEDWFVELDSEESKDLKDKLIKNLMSGHLMVSVPEEGKKMSVVQHLRKPMGEGRDSITHKFMHVEQLVEVDGVKEDDNYKRMVATVSASTREAEAVIRKQMIPKDLYTGFWVGSLFLLP